MQFWNKIKILKGMKTTYTNYMKDTEGKKVFFPIKKKRFLIEKKLERRFHDYGRRKQF